MKKEEKEQKRPIRRISLISKKALFKAIRDLELEIRRASRKKAEFERVKRKISLIIKSKKKVERLYQREISRVKKKEAALYRKKASFQRKIDNIGEKINKISRLEKEIKKV